MTRIQSEWHSFPAESTREKHLTLPTERGKKKEKEMKGSRRMALNPRESMYTNFTCDLHVRTITLHRPLF